VNKSESRTHLVQQQIIGDGITDRNQIALYGLAYLFS
jgi:hypothetical protein